MVAWTTPRTWASGDVVTAAMLNAHLRDNLLVLAHGNEYYVKVYLDGSASIPNNTSTSVSWTTVEFERHDASAMWSVANPTRLVAPIAGKYAVALNVEWRSNATGIRSCSLVRNSPALTLPGQAQNSDSEAVNTSSYFEVDLAAAAYVEAKVLQASGAALDLHGGTPDRTRCAMWLIGT